MSASRDLSTDELLSTTRSVRRRLDFDRKVPRELVRECLSLAFQAPRAFNLSLSRFLVVEDEERRKALAELYRKGFEIYRDLPFAAGNLATGDRVHDKTQRRVASSTEYLAENLHRAPVMVVPCLTGWPEESPSRPGVASAMGSLLPAAWSFCLAARSRSLGTAWTTLHLFFEQEAADILDISYDTTWQVALIPVAYTRGGAFKPAAREPLDSIVTFYD
ncbi:nitroreductase family protein [Allokutzneria sp. A3M-2-11 16]|uniref:nitroreductase family protein n=1 Tax=Allokutzneria sp. A3M-2-11 16 TaxID=2962043 RepID=UPI0020B68B56|nr:nitroreductase family protein [Allokutzneria sp. A3M-2-11 16]MCP3803457.1 nitroreductase family protein [Allokutzneria sp. A3M-2-11 16]